MCSLHQIKYTFLHFGILKNNVLLFFFFWCNSWHAGIVAVLFWIAHLEASQRYFLFSFKAKPYFLYYGEKYVLKFALYLVCRGFIYLSQKDPEKADNEKCW